MRLRREFVTHATVPKIRIEVCSKCHPFYTGKQKLVDRHGSRRALPERWGSHIEDRIARISGQQTAEKSDK